MCGFVGKYKNISVSDCIEILEAEPIGYIGTCGNDSMEVVPMYYVTSCLNDNFVIYFMLMSFGESMQNMTSKEMITFLVTQIVDSCLKSVYNSVVVKGKYESVESRNEQNYIKQLFEEKYCFHPDALDSYKCKEIYYVKMNVNEITGRAYYKNIY